MSLQTVLNKIALLADNQQNKAAAFRSVMEELAQELHPDGSSSVTYSKYAKIEPEISASTYIIQATDAGKVLRFTNASGVTITVPSGLPDGFQVLGYYEGTGIADFVAGSGTKVRGKNNGSTLQEQYDPFYLVKVGNDGTDDLFNLSGDLV
mgnify:CR=1 FL=1